jgi:RHS repeat-associated protein
MSAKAPTADQIISLPKGGGALRGIGEKFAPDLQTGTGNFSVPIELPPGRNGFQPQLQLAYSTGNPNGAFGLGWGLSVPGIQRKTSKGVPRYDDARDVFILSGAEDLVPVAGGPPGTTRYRPRTEGLFARILHHHGEGENYWEVRTRDGLVSIYGTRGEPRSGEERAVVVDPDDPRSGEERAVVVDPDDPRRIFAWRLTETTDPFGNRIEYEYERDERRHDGPHHWDQLRLREVRYIDYGPRENPEFLVRVTLEHEPRPDPFSDYRAGFEIRTVRRCSRIEIRTNGMLSRSYTLSYLPQEMARNGVSLLGRIQVTGHDGDRTEQLPPLELGYTAFEPEGRRYQPLSAVGDALPERSLGNREFELVDLFGNGLPSVVQMNDAVARYWRNRGGGRLDPPRSMREAPAGVSLADRGVQIADMDGDGRPDLLVADGVRSGYYSLDRDGAWDRRGFRSFPNPPTVGLEDPDVRLLDLEGNGIIGALRTGPSFELYFNDREQGWDRVEPRPRGRLENFPDVTFTDPRVKLAEMTGDGLQSIVLIHQGRVDYWPYLGHGRWGRRITMRNSPRFEDAAQFLPVGFDPRRVLLGDVDRDGCADLVYVGLDEVTVWLNQGGDRWSDPITIDGTPRITDLDAVRLADMLGTGPGILWTYDLGAQRDSTFKFLELAGGTKPHLLSRIDNHMGAVTEVEYAPSTRFYLEDERRPETRRKTTLPFPVQVVARVRTYDQFSRGKLTTEYRYHYPYWDGPEQEFRGFGRVDQRDTQVFEDYNEEAGDAFDAVSARSFSPPTETRTWFHLGPVGPEFGDWEELDYGDEFFAGDAPLLRRPQMPDLDRRALRDAVRSLRGHLIRTELYALDDSDREARPFTVTEQTHAIRVETDGVYFPHIVGERTTQWERGDDPLTRAVFTDAYDEYGLPTTRLEVAAPRRGSGNRHLATETVTTHARRDDAERYIVDRVARETRYEVHDDGRPSPVALHEAVAAGSVGRSVIGQTLTFYDGPAFEGLGVGFVGEFGALVRTEELVLTEALLREIFGDEQPPYLTAEPVTPWTDEYPLAFRDAVRTGYTFRPSGAASAAGYFAATERRSYDFHAEGPVSRGLIRARMDARDGRMTIRYDDFDLLPTRVEDAAGLIQAATYTYRVLAPEEARDPNGNRTRFTYTPLGLVATTVALGKEGEQVGDTMEQPGARFEYDLLAAERGQPISVHAIRREQHRWEIVRLENEQRIQAGEPELTAVELLALFPDQEVAQFPERFLQTRDYSDGLGRLLQTRGQAEDVVFGDGDRGDSALPLSRCSSPGDAVGNLHRPTDPRGPRVVVSGWHIYDNKGRVVEKYEPFFALGFSYAPPTAEQRGMRTMLEYDALGRGVRTIAPDGSEHRIVRGIPVSLSDPTNFGPSPWVTFRYDANDNAGRTHPDEAASYQAHWNTPSNDRVDALGRTVESVERLGARAQDELTTRSDYDIRGNLVSLTDPLGRLAFAAVYDLLDRAWKAEQLDGGARLSALDAAGNALERRDAKGALTLRAFDALNRTVRLWARDRAGERLTLRERIVYGDAADPRLNARSRILDHFDEAGLESCRYDFKGNMLEQSRRVFRDDVITAAQESASTTGSAAAAFRVDWEGAAPDELLEATTHANSLQYDALNRPTRIRYPTAADGSRAELLLQYDRAGALVRVELDDAAFVDRIAYNARRQRILVVYGNGLMTRYAYDARTFRLARLRTEPFRTPTAETYAPTGAPLQDFTYGYDLLGNVLTLADCTPGSGVPPQPDTLDRVCRYDALSRLVYATGRECNVPISPQWDDAPRCADLTSARNYAEEYRYDAVGNLDSLEHGSNGGALTRAFALAPGTNRLASVTVGGQQFAYTYDACGNLVGETESRHLEWDHADRLQTFRVQSGAGPPSVYAQYFYDGAGQRVKKLVRRGASVVETTVYVGAGFEHRRERVATSVSESSTVHIFDGSQRIAEARRGPALPGDATPSIKFHLGDHLGSSNVVVEAAGTIIGREEYTPYGETSLGGFARKRYRFNGNERDGESGLYDFGARYFAPWIARWTSCDPAGIVDGANPYVYARDSPIRLRDPDGRTVMPHPLEEQAQASVPHLHGTAREEQELRSIPEEHARSPRPRNDPTLGSAVAHLTGVLTGEIAVEGAGSRSVPSGLTPAQVRYVTQRPIFVRNPTDRPEAMLNFWLSVAAMALGSLARAPVGIARAAPRPAPPTRFATDAEIEVALSSMRPAGDLLPNPPRPPPAPDFIGAGPYGPLLAVASGSVGPVVTVNPQGRPTGTAFVGGAGGKSLDPRVSSLRMMDPDAKYPSGYNVYQNNPVTGGPQGVNPYTGKTLPRGDPLRHIPNVTDPPGNPR